MSMIGVLIAMSMGGGTAGPAQAVNLSYKPFPNGLLAGSNVFGYRWNGSLMAGEAGPPLPSGAGSALRIVLVERDFSEGRRPETQGIVAKSSAGANGRDAVWIDWNHNGVFEASEKATRTFRKGDVSVYTPSTPPTIGGLTARVRYVVKGEDFKLEPAGYYEGVAKIGGRPVKVGVVDADLTGTVGIAGNEFNYDFLLVDYNGNGVMDGPPASEGAITNPGESVSFSNTVLMPDKAFYSVRVSPTGRRLTLKKVASGTATMAAKDGRLLRMQLFGPELALESRDIGGSCPAIPGTFRQVSGAVGKGGWVCEFYSERKPFAIRSGQSVKLDGLTPKKLTLSATQGNGGWNFSVGCVTASSGSVSGVYRPNGEQVKEPQLAIRNSSGRTVKLLALEYG